MGLKECQIRFDNPYRTYYVGQTINGTIELHFDAPKTVRGISICFKGEANTSWTVDEVQSSAGSATDGQQQNRQVEKVPITGNEEYFKIQYYLVGGQGESEITIPAGFQSYPFTCMLPPTLPSSFEGEFGHIRYTVKVTLDRPWKFDQEIKDVFTVLSPLDLNLTPRLKEPFKKDFEKFFCCCWCKSGPLTFILSLPQTGFVSGQNIPILCELDNVSNVDVLNVYFVLNKIVVYHTQTPRRETRRETVMISEVTTEPVPAHESKTWHQQIAIPPLPPSNLANCTLIDLAYELQVEARVDGFHANLVCVIPITIGTVPLSGQQPALGGQPGTVAVNMNPQQPPVQPNSGYPSQPNTGFPPQPNSGFPPQSNSGFANSGFPPQPNSGFPLQTNSGFPSQPNSGYPSQPNTGYPEPNTNGGSLYPDMSQPQPTFAPSKFGTNSIQDRHDNEHVRYPNNQQFTPMYPVYNFNNQGAA